MTKIRLRLVGPDGRQKTDTIKVRNKDIIICKTPLGMKPFHIDKLKELFIKAFTLEGPNLIIVPKDIDISVLKVESEGTKPKRSIKKVVQEVNSMEKDDEHFPLFKPWKRSRTTDKIRNEMIRLMEKEGIPNLKQAYKITTNLLKGEKNENSEY